MWGANKNRFVIKVFLLVVLMIATFVPFENKHVQLVSVAFFAAGSRWVVVKPPDLI